MKVLLLVVFVFFGCGFLREVQRDFVTTLEAELHDSKDELVSEFESQIDEIVNRVGQQIDAEAAEIQSQITTRLGPYLASKVDDAKDKVESLKSLLEEVDSTLGVLESVFDIETSKLRDLISNVNSRLSSTEEKVDAILSDPKVQLLSLAVQKIGKDLARQSIKQQKKDFRFYLGFFLWMLGGLIYGISKVVMKKV